MKEKYVLLILLAVLNAATGSRWNNLNCPAPRAPDNGLSFIFRNGDLVQFRCHPGYQMRGHPVAHCVNNVWSTSAPECIPIKTFSGHRFHDLNNELRNPPNRQFDHQHEKWKVEKHRQLFNWGDDASKQNVYGDGPRRLPLINGIWPPQDHVNQVLSLGPQGTPVPHEMIKEEINIAELRNQQLEELRRRRYEDNVGGKYRQGRKKKHKSVFEESMPRETVISLGTTVDGHALSVARAGPQSFEKAPSVVRHKHRHQKGHRRKSPQTTPNPLDPAGYFNNIISRGSRVNKNVPPPYLPRYNFNNSILETRVTTTPPPTYYSRRHHNNYIGNNIVQPIANTSVPKFYNRYHSAFYRKNNIAELRRRAVEQVSLVNGSLPLSDYDTSCVESFFRREVPVIAPDIQNGFVYRYETRKNRDYPFNSYMTVKYRCFNGFSFQDAARSLYCKEGSWVGKTPNCI